MNYSSLISIGNIFQAWEEFKRGKRNKKDVQVFERYLEDNLFDLHSKLKSRQYRHGGYREFYVNDPKRRHIHKAGVSDRIVHHLLYKYLYQIFDGTFIYDSYSCRLGKGTHKAVKRLEYFCRKLSQNYTSNCWALKLDIKQFFASVDHEILISLITKKVNDKGILWLVSEVVNSFPIGVKPLKGIPLGNLTSQIFANIYLNELDQFIKHELKGSYYIRYADDFIILYKSEKVLKECLVSLENFLDESLKLRLHPKKIIFRKFEWGIDFCGYIVLPHYTLPRTKTKGRIFKKVLMSQLNEQSLQSYLGYFSHANSYTVTKNLKSIAWLTSNI